MTAIDRTEDATNVVTRLYVEGEYGDNGYVGIDDVNPTGLPFLLNFGYYRALGVFTEAHEQALADYLRDMATAKADSGETVKRLIDLDNQLNELWGQIDYVLYVLEEGSISRTILGGDASAEQADVKAEDEITVLLPDGTYKNQTGGTFQRDAEYAIKWIQRASAVIGGKEVAVEAKKETILSLQKLMEKETDREKQQEMLAQIAAREKAIERIYTGDAENKGLYALMREAVLLVIERDDTNALYTAAMSGQEAIEQRFAEAMGDMLRDGYWSNTSYVPGQEELLYLEACEIMEKLSKPSVTYNVTIQNLSGISGYEQERFRINTALRIWDEALGLNDWAYVTKLTEHDAVPEKDSITISNDLTSVGSLSLDSVIARITGIAETLNNKKALYDRSKAISEDGSIPAKRLEGMIDVLKTRLSSATSNWYTDDQGNLILAAANGSSIMKLCGEGFMIAYEKDDNGDWLWRTFGTGEGFTADLIVAGFLSADRIQAHTITANHLASDVGQSLDLSSNQSIRLTVEETVDASIGYRLEIYTDRGEVLSEHVRETTLKARVWHGNEEVTDTLDASRFHWRRTSQDETADQLWNTAHEGMKSITLTTTDVQFSASYTCELMEE